ncbi:MAG: C25 family cysteine peptidase [Planctomycetota bacterium]|nr:C25 family cysteine peptidase [Planctomycetota bacterium]
MRTPWSALFACVLLAAAPLHAATITWTGNGIDSNWNNPNNWSSTSVPGPLDTVVFKNNRPVVVNVPVTVASLTMSNYNASLTLNANLTVNGDWTVGGTGFTLTGAGANTLTAGRLTIDTSASYTQTGGQVLIQGAVTVSNHATFRVSGGSFVAAGDIDLNNHSYMVIDGGLVRADGDFNMNNHSTVDLNPGGTLSIGESLNLEKHAQFNNNGGMLPVTVADFSARPEAGGILVEWRVASEYENLGFNLWRRAAPPHAGAEPERLWRQAGSFRQAGWRMVNENLIPGRLTHPTPRAYRWFDAPEEGRYEYALESVALDGSRELYPFASAPAAVLPAAGAAPDPETLDAILARIERALAAQRAARNREALLRAAGNLPRARIAPLDPRGGPGAPAAGARGAVAARAAGDEAEVNELPAYSAPGLKLPFVAPPARGYDAAKLVSTGRGVLRVDQAALPAGYDVARLDVRYEGRRMRALALEGDALYLYAQGYEDAYTDRDAYFLRAGARTRAGRAPSARGLFSSNRPAQGAAGGHAQLEFDAVYFSFGSQPVVNRPYFASEFLTSGSAHAFQLATPFAQSDPATLSVTVYSHSPDAHELQAVLNGTPLGAARWQGGQRMLRLTFDVPAGLLRDAAANAIDLLTPDLGVPQTAFLYSIEIDYRKALAGPGPVEILDGVRGLVEVRDLPSDRLWVVDARNPRAARLAPYEVQAQDGGGFRARFWAVANGRGQGYLVVPQGAEAAPLAVTEVRVDPLPRGIEYLAVGPAAFGATFAPLVARREAEGLDARYADQQALFDAYGDGRYGPAGIRRAAFKLRGSLQYLCLVGRTTSDYKDRAAPYGIDPLCPTILASTPTFAEIPADPLYADFGRGPRFAVGRFPVNTAGELAVAVQRTLDFVPIQGASGGLGLLAADRRDLEAGHFGLGCEALEAACPQLTWDKAYLGQTAPAAADLTQAMRDAANGGADVIVFNGHGASNRLSRENVLDAAKAAQWTGNCVLIQATCTANYFMHDLPAIDTNAELLLTQPQGGIAASIGPTTYTPHGILVDFNKLLLEELQPGRSWGTALMHAQQRAWTLSSHMARTRDPNAALLRALTYGECLLGDPALPIYAP